MNKGEFTTALAELTELSKADANRALDGILDTLTEAMADRDEISFPGWGKFGAQKRKGREARDPRNPRRTIHIAPGYVPRFKAGSVLKREVAEAPASVRSRSNRRTAGGTAGDAPAEEAAASSAEISDGVSSAHHSNGRGHHSAPSRWRPLGDR